MVAFQIKLHTLESSYVTTSHLFKTPNFPSQVTTFGTSSKQSPLIIESKPLFWQPRCHGSLGLVPRDHRKNFADFWMTVYFFFILFILPKATTLRHGVMISLFGVCTKLVPVCKQLLVAALLSIWNGIQWIPLWNVVLTSHKQPFSVNLHILGGCLQEAQLLYHRGEWRSKT